jgi:hypothetical protein
MLRGEYPTQSNYAGVWNFVGGQWQQVKELNFLLIMFENIDVE